jgi:hypothetical protein
VVGVADGDCALALAMTGPAGAGAAEQINAIVAAINAAAIDPAILPISSSPVPASRSDIIHFVKAWCDGQL